METDQTNNQLYHWQEQCLERWFKNNGRGIVQAVTGSGKTLLALTAANRLEHLLGQTLFVKIVVPSGTLMQQWNQALTTFLATGENHTGTGAFTDGYSSLRKHIGLRGNGYKTPTDRKYMIYVINSARYELARQILEQLRGGKHVLLIADECHHYESGQNSLIFEFLPYINKYEKQFFSLGLTATLSNGHAQHFLTSVLGRKIYSYGASEAAAQHTICPYDIYHIQLAFEKQEREAYDSISERIQYLYQKLLSSHPYLKHMSQKERYESLKTLAVGENHTLAQIASMYMALTYKRKSLVCLASARTACAYDLIKLLPANEKILIFGERIGQADNLYHLLQECYPGKIGRCHSKMGIQANKNTLERFRTGDIRILISCKSMDEGVDLPDASIGIILSGTAAHRQRIQRLGRIIHKCKDKKRALLYYLHISETTEDSNFLPEHTGSRVFDLEYLSGSHKFLHPPYDKQAGILIQNIQQAGANDDKIQESERCLKLGRVRSDWMMEYVEIKQQVLGARYASDKNYWICMKKLNEMSNSSKTRIP